MDCNDLHQEADSSVSDKPNEKIDVTVQDYACRLETLEKQVQENVTEIHSLSSAMKKRPQIQQIIPSRNLSTTS